MTQRRIQKLAVVALIGTLIAGLTGCEETLCDALQDTLDNAPQFDDFAELDILDVQLAWGSQLSGTILIEAPGLRFSLKSDVEGMLLESVPAGDGSWHWYGELSEGAHLISLEVYSGQIFIGQLVQGVRVRGNQAPGCAIVYPGDGATFEQHDLIPFQAGAFDKDGDPLQVLWRSSLDGGLFEGESWEQRLLQTGEHRISISVLDGFGGLCQDEITIFIR